MFDPTIYENLKVVMEGIVYDLDLDGTISVTERNDIVDLATMSRQYKLTFQLKNRSSRCFATIILQADSEDLYGEILESGNAIVGCTLSFLLDVPLPHLEKVPDHIQEHLQTIWGNRPSIKQIVQYQWVPNETIHYHCKISIIFDRKINEDQISDFPKVIKLLLKSLMTVERIIDMS